MHAHRTGPPNPIGSACTGADRTMASSIAGAEWSRIQLEARQWFVKLARIRDVLNSGAGTAMPMGDCRHVNQYRRAPLASMATFSEVPLFSSGRNVGLIAFLRMENSHIMSNYIIHDGSYRVDCKNSTRSWSSPWFFRIISCGHLE